MNDPLTEAILAAGRELGLEYNWTFDGGVEKAPKEESVFTQVLLKHLAPLAKGTLKEFINAEMAGATSKLCTLAAKLKELEEHA